MGERRDIRQYLKIMKIMSTISLSHLTFGTRQRDQVLTNPLDVINTRVKSAQVRQATCTCNIYLGTVDSTQPDATVRSNPPRNRLNYIGLGPILCENHACINCITTTNIGSSVPNHKIAAGGDLQYLVLTLPPQRLAQGYGGYVGSRGATCKSREISIWALSKHVVCTCSVARG